MGYPIEFTVKGKRLRFTLSRHAQEEMERRQTPLEILDAVLQHPEQIVEGSGGKKAYQSRVKLGGRLYLLRAIVNDQDDPAIVVTVYRTSKVGKYWRLQ